MRPFRLSMLYPSANGDQDLKRLFFSSRRSYDGDSTIDGSSSSNANCEFSTWFFAVVGINPSSHKSFRLVANVFNILRTSRIWPFCSSSWPAATSCESFMPCAKRTM